MADEEDGEDSPHMRLMNNIQHSPLGRSYVPLDTKKPPFQSESSSIPTILRRSQSLSPNSPPPCYFLPSDIFDYQTKENTNQDFKQSRWRFDSEDFYNNYFSNGLRSTNENHRSFVEPFSSGVSSESSLYRNHHSFSPNCWSRYPEGSRILNQFNSVSTQTENHTLNDETFLLRETILMGCDLVDGVGAYDHSIAELKLYSDCIREKTLGLQPKSQNMRARGQDEIHTFKEHLKTFFMVSEAWLEARNCFGSGDQCTNEISNAYSRDLSKSYLEWMNSSGKLLKSTVNSLQRIIPISQRSKPPHIAEQAKRMISYVPIAIANRPIQQNPTSSESAPNMAIMNDRGMFSPFWRTHNEYQDQFQGADEKYPDLEWFNALPNCCVRSDTSSPQNHEDQNYLQPASYDAPRSDISHHKKYTNIIKAKSDCCIQIRQSTIGYVIKLTNKNIKRENISSVLSRKPKEEEEATDNILSDDKTDEDFLAVDLLTSLNLAKISNEETKWLASVLQVKDGNEATSIDSNQIDEEYCESSNHESDTTESIEDQDKKRVQKKIKPTWQHIKRRKSLTHRQLQQIQDIVKELWKCDLPEYMKYNNKRNQSQDQIESHRKVKNSIFLETISNKCKIGLYETLEQFVYDCRRMFFNAKNFSENIADKEKIEADSKKIESLFEQNFEQIKSMKHITGDPKEMKFNSELRYIRKRVKNPKCSLVDETTENKLIVKEKKWM